MHAVNYLQLGLTTGEFLKFSVVHNVWVIPCNFKQLWIIWALLALLHHLDHFQMNPKYDLDGETMAQKVGMAFHGLEDLQNV